MKILGSRGRMWAMCVALLASVAVVGCGGGDSNGGGSYPTQGSAYQGGYTESGGGAGGVSFAIAGAKAQTGEPLLGGSQVAATGELRPAGQSAVALAGTYDTTTYTLQLVQTAKGVNPYSLAGLLQAGGFRGTVTTPSGSGGFAAVPVTVAGSETVFCGSYSCNSCEGGGGGYFDSIVFGTTIVVGVRSFESQESLALAGTVNGAAVSIDDQGIVATGTITGGSIAGDYTATAGEVVETGTWLGSTDACGVARRR